MSSGGQYWVSPDTNGSVIQAHRAYGRPIRNWYDSAMGVFASSNFIEEIASR